MKAARLLVIAVAALVWAAPASASYFYYNRTSLTNSYFEAVDNFGDWTDARAGSGSGTDACQHYNWIPLGYYSVLWHDDYFDGTKIKGRVWRLSDYQCSNGVRRTELFVHSEETPSKGNRATRAATRRSAGKAPATTTRTAASSSRGVRHRRDLGRVDNFVHAYGHATDLWVYS